MNPRPTLNPNQALAASVESLASACAESTAVSCQGKRLLDCRFIRVKVQGVGSNSLRDPLPKGPPIFGHPHSGAWCLGVVGSRLWSCRLQVQEFVVRRLSAKKVGSILQARLNEHFIAGPSRIISRGLDVLIFHSLSKRSRRPLMRAIV